jgi:uncharacterized membrane protein
MHRPDHSSGRLALWEYADIRGYIHPAAGRIARRAKMGSNRLEAFSDGVIAILITIMILDLKIPPEALSRFSSDWTALRSVLPTALTYVLSFVFLGIYWNNHHHMLHVTDRINGKILWANLHLLFWLSLVPFTTGWMGERHFAPVPTALYGIVLLFAAAAYTILQTAIISSQGPHSRLAAAVHGDVKGKFSLIGYFAAIPLAFFVPWVSCVLYAAIAIVWLVPDPRIEATIAHD